MLISYLSQCISFSIFCIEVLIIRYDKIVSHMTPTCAFVFVIKAHDLPYLLLCHGRDVHPTWVMFAMTGTLMMSNSLLSQAKTLRRVMGGLVHGK
jgi:hypothetical protein